MLNIKRIYGEALASDGSRILVDRLWPRGISKDKAHLALWAKDIAPSTDLRKAFKHEGEMFPWFKKEYIKELNGNPAAVGFLAEVKQMLAKGPVTLLYGAKNTEYNHAIVLSGYIKDRLGIN